NAHSLKIETESASRRLKKKVYFSIGEMGILAQKLGISIDGLLNFSQGYSSTPSYTMHLPKNVESIDVLHKKMKNDLNLLGELGNEPTECGLIFNSLPLEFVIPYNDLLKFVYFKWGYYYIGSEEYNHFSSWRVPAKLLSLNDEVLEVFQQWESIVYIWDISAVWCLVKDITYFYDLQALESNDVASIKRDLHRMLNDMEKVTNGISVNHMDAGKMQIYISTVHLGGQFSYYISKNKWYSSFHTYFIGSNYSDDYDTCIQMRDWLHSMKKVCTLVSDSGAKERRLFFEEQHKIVDSV
ncbi:MAG: hypothetical protein LIO93_05395, partial [Bacteroidales bacterium]|nr:hypothetical protein [Bacteroidales bacterium]